ncbi:MAG: hypothetical protein JNK64_27185 [Myxococcales bacterium]|nr:hypothetical protein [Myxococcales bacterium]
MVEATSLSESQDHWLDAVLAAPVVGVQLSMKPSARLRLRDELGPFVDRLSAEVATVNLVAASNGATIVESSDGFTIKIAHDAGAVNVVAEYSFNPVEERRAGALPAVRFDNLPYSKLLEVGRVRTTDLLVTLSARLDMTIGRVGIVARARLGEFQLPPGLQAFRGWMTDSWQRGGSSLVKCNGTFLSRFPAVEGVSSRDQCHHHLAYDTESASVEYDVMLDYQRVWKQPISVVDSGVSINEVASAALQYYSDFAFPEGPWPPR